MVQDMTDLFTINLQAKCQHQWRWHNDACAWRCETCGVPTNPAEAIKGTEHDPLTHMDPSVAPVQLQAFPWSNQ